MNRSKGVAAYFLYGLILLSAGECIASGQILRWQGRLDMSLAHDDNVFEFLEQPLDDNNARLSLYLNTQSNFSKVHQIKFNCRSGIEGYRQYNQENRFIQYTSLNYQITTIRKISIGLNGQSRWRKFFQVERGYQWQKLETTIQAILPYGLMVKGFSSLSWMNYAGSDLFDFTSRTDGLSLIWHHSPKFHFFSKYSTELMEYNRFAFGLDYPNMEGQLLPKNEKQHNLIYNVAFGLEWMGWLLCRAEVSYQWQVSNSYGYDYETPNFECMLVKSLPWSLTVRCFGRYQNKHYAESFEPFQITPYVETEENTQLLCDLIRDFSKDRSARLRVGWYLNESPFRNLYYEKTVFSLGVSQSF